jgi:secreted trypsin-like serine protease
MQYYIKLAVIMVSFFAVFISTGSEAKGSEAKGSEVISVSPKIVGGEVANEGDWPWLSALVYTYNDISTTLIVDNTSYVSQAFTGGFIGTATGDTIDCGIGDTECPNATEKICLIERGEINFSAKVENCQAGGGIGAIIFNNKEGIINGTLGDNFTGTIPAVSITQADGAILQSNIGASASLSVIEGNASAQSLTCGASFLGGKWLLTASHCVDGTSADQLKVNVGEYNLSDGAENAKTVKRIYMHADYQLGAELNNDIALIELVDSVNNTPISLIDLPSTEQFSQQNSSVTVAGWGGREGYEPNDGPTSNFPTILHQVDLQLLTNEECKSLFAESHTDTFGGTFTPADIDVTDAMICAHILGGGKGACQGDSGGPLMIETNVGWQQIGIVSWGIGCAADGFPGVYTRTGLFNDWVNEITQGIAIDQDFDFPIQITNTTSSANLTVINNSQLSANLTFSIEGSSNFTIANDSCNQIAVGATCLLQVDYHSTEAGIHTAKVLITSDNSDIPTSTATISAQTIALASNIKAQLSSTDDALTWYSGGNLPWQLDNFSTAIVSGNITGNQKSIVMVTVSGEGELSFDWSVSSEENTEDQSQPFDALYLYVDDELIKFISGDVAYQTETVNFSAGEHKITWVYQKDPFTSEGDDNAHIRNITFTPTGSVTPDTSPETNSGSGGSLNWLSLLFLVVLRLKRKK